LPIRLALGSQQPVEFMAVGCRRIRASKRYEFTRELSSSPNLIRLIEFDFTKLNLNLVEKIELD
jgi:hypothetical protein